MAIIIGAELECLALSGSSTLVYYLWERLDPNIVEPLVKPLSNGRRLALPTNIKLGLKWLTLANTLAYYNVAIDIL
jgi:hypothetical protein